MDFASLAAFAGAYLAVVALPGPGITALVARVLVRGTQGVPAFVARLAAGSLVWFTVAATGAAVLASAFAGLFLAVRYAGAAYLLYLAWRLWTAPVRPMEATPATSGTPFEGQGRLFLAGLSVSLGNPKAVVFFLALLPTVVDLGALTPLGFTELAAVVVATVAGVNAAYATAAGRARRLFTSPRAVRLVNRGSSVAMAGAAAAVATR